MTGCLRGSIAPDEPERGVRVDPYPCPFKGGCGEHRQVVYGEGINREGMERRDRDTKCV